MSDVLKQRDFLKEVDFTRDELQHLIDLAADLKAAKKAGTEQQHLAGQSIALIFEKSSTRTRCAFEVAAHDQGGHVTYLDPTSSQIGHKESAADTARVLSRMFNAIEFRGKSQPRWKSWLSSQTFPCTTASPTSGTPRRCWRTSSPWKSTRPRAPPAPSYCFLGDGRFNMGRSLLVTGAIMGSDVRICAPRTLWPDAEVQAIARARAEKSGATITLTDDLDEGLSGASSCTPTSGCRWVSLRRCGRLRVRELMPYQVNATAMARTGNPSGQVHALSACPPRRDAQRWAERSPTSPESPDGLEVTDEVFGSSANIAFDQAENRLHTIKALMVATLGR